MNHESISIESIEVTFNTENYKISRVKRVNYERRDLKWNYSLCVKDEGTTRVNGLYRNDYGNKDRVNLIIQNTHREHVSSQLNEILG